MNCKLYAWYSQSGPDHEKGDMKTRLRITGGYFFSTLLLMMIKISSFPGRQKSIRFQNYHKNCYDRAVYNSVCASFFLMHGGRRRVLSTCIKPASLKQKAKLVRFFLSFYHWAWLFPLKKPVIWRCAPRAGLCSICEAAHKTYHIVIL